MSERSTVPSSDRGATLPATEPWFFQVLDAIDFGILLVDREGSVRFANSQAQFLAAAAKVDSVRTFLESLSKADGVAVVRQPLRGSDGLELVLLRTSDTGARAEAALGRVVRLEEALRDLSVVSHKINNPITALLGRAQMLRARSHAEPSVDKSVTVIDESAVRIAELAKELSKRLKEARRDSVDALIALDRPEPVGT